MASSSPRGRRADQSVCREQPGCVLHNETNCFSHALAVPVQPPDQLQPLSELQESELWFKLHGKAEPPQLLVELFQ